MLFHEDLSSKPRYKEFSVIKDMLILSHGQSAVERAFSDNKDIMRDNMSEHTLIAYRQAHESLRTDLYLDFAIVICIHINIDIFHGMMIDTVGCNCNTRLNSHIKFQNSYLVVYSSLFHIQ